MVAGWSVGDWRRRRARPGRPSIPNRPPPRGDHGPQPRRPVHDRQLVVDAAAAGEPADELSRLHGRAQEPARRHAQPPPRGDLRPTRGRATAASPAATRTGGNKGIFQYTPRGTCTASPLTAGRDLPVQRRRRRPTTRGDISAAFTCIAALGDRGCGFEHQFESVLRALGADGKAAPAENQGFLRRDALLAIIMLTNEDDCSARPGVAALRHGLEHQSRRRSSGRPRTSAATSSVTSATARSRPARRRAARSPLRSVCRTARRPSAAGR